MTAIRTSLGREIETALGEVLAHVRGEIELLGRIMDDSAAHPPRTIRFRLELGREKLAETDEHS